MKLAHLRIDELMKEKSQRVGYRITQQILSDAVNVSQGTLSRWIGNKIDRLELDILVKLCDYFECEPGDLIVIRER